MYHCFHKNIKQIRDIKMISEISCDTENSSNDAEKSACPRQE